MQQDHLVVDRTSITIGLPHKLAPGQRQAGVPPTRAQLVGNREPRHAITMATMPAITKGPNPFD